MERAFWGGEGPREEAISWKGLTKKLEDLVSVYFAVLLTFTRATPALCRCSLFLWHLQTFMFVLFWSPLTFGLQLKEEKFFGSFLGDYSISFRDEQFRLACDELLSHLRNYVNHSERHLEVFNMFLQVGSISALTFSFPVIMLLRTNVIPGREVFDIVSLGMLGIVSHWYLLSLTQFIYEILGML